MSSLSRIPRWRLRETDKEKPPPGTADSFAADKVIAHSTKGGELYWHLECGVCVTVSHSLDTKPPQVPGASGGCSNPMGGYYIRRDDGTEDWFSAKYFEKEAIRI